MSDTRVASVILQQLGGKRFTGMTGAKNLVADETSLRFALPRNPKKVTHVQIDLTPSDTYRMIFWNCGLGKNFHMDIVSQVEDVYAEDLQNIFTESTGLYTRL